MESKTDSRPDHYDDYLLSLTGGDMNIVRKILIQIEKEIPPAIIKLKEAAKNEDNYELGIICHHMVSTFAPMGKNTIVMEKIEHLRSIEKNKTGTTAIDKLIEELTQHLLFLKKELAQKNNK